MISALSLLVSGSRGLGTIFDAEEFENQVNYEQQILDNNSRMVVAQKDASIRDVMRRRDIMAGQAEAIASKNGVRITGSVVEAVGDIKAQAEVDKLRIQVQANNQILLNRMRSDEMGRQGTKKKIGAYADAFIGGGLSVWSSTK